MCMALSLPLQRKDKKRESEICQYGVGEAVEYRALQCITRTRIIVLHYITSQVTALTDIALQVCTQVIAEVHGDDGGWGLACA